MNLEEKIRNYEQAIKDFFEALEDLKIEKQKAEKPKNRFWKPNDTEAFISIELDFKAVEHDSDFRKPIVDIANCYPIEEKELAKKDEEKMKARQIIQRTADQLHGGRYYFDFYRYNYVVSYDDCGKLAVERLVSTNIGAIVFCTEELAQKCLKECEKEYRILLGVE